jgi:hypothetical protein
MSLVTLDRRAPAHDVPAHHDRSLVDLVERAIDADLACSCGRPTRVVERDGALWLQCSAVGDPAGGRLRRMMRRVIDGLHLREHIVDVPGRRAAA